MYILPNIQVSFYLTTPTCTTNPLPSRNPSPTSLSGTCQHQNLSTKLFNHASNTSGLRNCCATNTIVGSSPSPRNRHSAAHVLFNGSIRLSLYMQSDAIIKSTADVADTSDVSQSSVSVLILSALALPPTLPFFFPFPLAFGNTTSRFSLMLWRSSLRT
jgi:hypothetical protein